VAAQLININGVAHNRLCGAGWDSRLGYRVGCVDLLLLGYGMLNSANLRGVRLRLQVRLGLGVRLGLAVVVVYYCRGVLCDGVLGLQ
jgi:hypothetical protein